MSSLSRTFAASATVESLRARALLLRHLRQFFDHRDFVEVQTPLFSRETVIDAHLDPISVPGDNLGWRVREEPWFLQTSPELLMKRLLASRDLPAIYQIGPVFRGGESGQRHNPEFTMAEWYRVGDTWREGVALLAELARQFFPYAPLTIATYAELFRAAVGLCPLAASDPDLQARAQASDDAPRGLDRDGALEWLFGACIEPTLRERTVIVTHYPATQAALARRSADDPRTAERFELFIDGVELANGYDELRDANELEARFTRQNHLRVARGAAPLPIPKLLLAAMREGLPACSGCALGVDRLLMLITGATSLREVLAFPADIA